MATDSETNPEWGGWKRTRMKRDEVRKEWIYRRWEEAQTDRETENELRLGGRSSGSFWSGGGCARNDRQSADEREKWGNRDGYLSGVSEFESEGREWNREEPQQIASHQRGMEESLLSEMSWRGVGALFHKRKLARARACVHECACACVFFCEVESYWVAG